MNNHHPSRTLNETSFSLLGLGPVDFVVIVGTYSLLQPAFYFFFQMSLVIPFLISLFEFLFLLKVRNSYRRHFVRDLALYLKTKMLRFGVYYDPEND